MAVETIVTASPNDSTCLAAQGPILLPETHGMASYEPLNAIGGTTADQMRFATLLTQGTGIPHRLSPEPDPQTDSGDTTERILCRRLPSI